MQFSNIKILVTVTGLFLSVMALAQKENYLHTQGKYIYNAAGEEVILRGIGTGNWFIQEGYMMQSGNVANTQSLFRKKLVNTIGEERTKEFYNSWLDNHMTRVDVDSMKAWGFNSIRIAMHYKWLTLPIEDEPVQGQDTWLEDGFKRLDSLLAWCSANEMYLILDLHGAPGGQGKDAAISDYDSSKPSLWESNENKRKTVALWGKLAERYANEPWIGGYDVLNEPNWDLPGGTALKNLYIQITNEIRKYDSNHILFFEGNWFANDYTGLTPAWDDNMAYSGHKYWSYNNADAIDYITNLRDNYNVPVWLGESGENSNTWFTQLIDICEEKHVGWSWWPVKKAGINNVLQVHDSQKYSNLISYWKNGSPAMTADQAFEAVMEWADNHRFENCDINYDVIDAMIRQPFSNETKPFKERKVGDDIYAVDYDLGRYNQAYYDSDSANYNSSTGTYVNWNQGWAYRNDGVDIEACTDAQGTDIPYNVGWTDDKEWLLYTLSADSTAAYTLQVRSASESSGSTFHIEVDGANATGSLKLAATGGWKTWNSQTFPNIVIPEGVHQIKFVFEKGGSNLHYFQFTNPTDANEVEFEATSASSSTDGHTIAIAVNKDITAFEAQTTDFTLNVADQNLNIASVGVKSGNPRFIEVKTNENIYYKQTIKISYSGNAIYSGSSTLTNFTDLAVTNNLPKRYNIPGKIEAEDYNVNNGLVFEECDEGGLNSGYANPGDYLDYLVYVKETATYKFTFRIATTNNNCKLDIRIGDGESFTSEGILNVTKTGGWQVWTDQTIELDLVQGYQTLRLYFMAGEFNINYFKSTITSGVNQNSILNEMKVFPNPTNGKVNLVANFNQNTEVQLQMIDISGKMVLDQKMGQGNKIDQWIDLSAYDKGIYWLKITNGIENHITKLVLN